MRYFSDSNCYPLSSVVVHVPVLQVSALRADGGALVTIWLDGIPATGTGTGAGTGSGVRTGTGPRTGSGAGTGAAAGSAPPGSPDLASYRDAVTDLVASFERSGAGACNRLAARALSRGLADPAIAAVVTRTPQGSAGALERLLLEVRGYRPGARSSAATLAALIRISLLAQIDALWWGQEPAYPTDSLSLIHI